MGSKNEGRSILERVRKCVWEFPDDVEVSKEAQDLIFGCLFQNPAKRTILEDIVKHKFFTKNKLPKALPFTFLNTPPTTEFMRGYIKNWLPPEEARLYAIQRAALGIGSDDEENGN